MNFPFKAAVVLAVAAALCAATLILVPRLRTCTAGAGGMETASEVIAPEDDAETDASGMAGSYAGGSRRTQPIRNGSGSSESLDDREEVDSEVEEMRNEIEEMIRKFRGTPEERQEVIDECEQGRELIQFFAELSLSSIEEMSPEELEKEREDFEKEYRAQLEYLQTGLLQDMLQTPEEQEVIGSAMDAAQDFLERIDAALLSAGY